MAGRTKDPEERRRKYEAARAAGLTGGPGHGPGDPPFEPGNDVALSSGIYSPAIVNPLAQARLEQYYTDKWPDHIKPPYLRSYLSDLAKQETMLDLLDAEIERLGIVDADTEDTVTKERVTGTEGNMRRTAHTRKRNAPLETRRRLAASIDKKWEQLGLTPMARAKLGKDVSETNVNLAKLLSEDDDKN